MSVINLKNAQKLYGSNSDIVVEISTINPSIASEWLKCNKNNRPVRRKHVNFLAREITEGNWQLNGQAIVIADDEQVLDGQHRLLAIIEAGKSIKTLVVYGIKPEAFRTIDTGAVRTGADALFLHFTDVHHHIVKAIATAVPWCIAMERQMLNYKEKIGNTGVIEYVRSHMTLLQCAETLSAYPMELRPLSLGPGTACYEMFNRKAPEVAQSFMERLYTGENLERTDIEFLLRAAFQKNAQRAAKFPTQAKIRMVIKGWNWRRRGMETASHQVITLGPSDDQRILIL